MSTQTSFSPSPFTKFGKSTKDLLKKKYDFEHSLKTVHKSSSGLGLESGTIVSDNGALKGYVKAAFPPTPYGATNLELYTDASSESKVSFTPFSLPKGLSLTTTLASKDKDRSFKQPAVGSLELEYRHESVAFGTTAKSDSETHKLDASLSVGFSGVSVGGSVAVDASKGADLQDYNYGIEYAQPEYTASIYTEKKGSSITAAYFQRLSAAHVLGGSFKYDLQGKSERAMSFGSEYRLNDATVLKSKIDLPSGDVSTHIEHRLSSPSVLLGIASGFNVRNSKIGADKVGINLTFGDMK